MTFFTFLLTLLILRYRMRAIKSITRREHRLRCSRLCYTLFSCSACCFAFHAAYSRCPCPSAPCRARRTLTGMILQQMACRRKSSRPFCVTWFVSLFFTHLLLTLLPGSCIDLHEVMWSRKFSIRQNMEIYRYLWRYFVARIPLDT